MRLIGQLSQGRITSSVTGQTEPLSNGPFKTSYGNVIQQFGRNNVGPCAWVWSIAVCSVRGSVTR